jgi:hypothetical protein
VKECSTCGESKPLPHFNRSKDRRDGYYPICRVCHSKAQAISRARRKERGDQPLHPRPGYRKPTPFYLDSQCARCRDTFRPRHGQQRYCSLTCANLARGVKAAQYRTCPQCGSEFKAYPSHRSSHCSKACAGRTRRTRPDRSEIPWQECKQCAAWFVRKGSRRVFCSPDCATIGNRTRAIGRYYELQAEQGDGRTPIRFRQAVDRRNKRLTAAWVEDVGIDYLIERDNGRCHLCGRKVSTRYTWPDNRTPSVDHLVPLSQGGEHSKANTALAHLGCNLSKHTRAVGEQLRMIG